jgi:hypothetical protein
MLATLDKTVVVVAIHAPLEVAVIVRVPPASVP